MATRARIAKVRMVKEGRGKGEGWGVSRSSSGRADGTNLTVSNCLYISAKDEKFEQTKQGGKDILCVLLLCSALK
jgi:hypothetical protein